MIDTDEEIRRHRPATRRPQQGVQWQSMRELHQRRSLENLNVHLHGVRVSLAAAAAATGIERTLHLAQADRHLAVVRALTGEDQ